MLNYGFVKKKSMLLKDYKSLEGSAKYLLIIILPGLKKKGVKVRKRKKNKREEIQRNRGKQNNGGGGESSRGLRKER